MNALSPTIDTADSHSGDRLGFLFCLAAALHAALILGIGFSRELQSRSAPRLEITLAQHRSDNDKADYLAQFDQAGSGTLAEKALLTKREDSPFRDNAAQDPQLLKLARSEPSRAQQAQLATTAKSQRKTALETADHSRSSSRQSGNDRDTQLNQEIASLEAKLDLQRQAYANRPKRRVLTSVSTKRAVDAEYLHHWRTRVETIGNRHYPEQARQRGIEGELRLRVALKPDGSVQEVKLLQSSGHALLDRAAMRIVHLAAPYAPFPAEMRREVDILEIIRTWRFEKNALTSSS